MRSTKHLWMLALLPMAACGISDGTLLVDLEPEDIDSLCEGTESEEFVCTKESSAGPISSTYPFSVGTCKQDLAVVDDCTATVGDWRSCDKTLRSALAEDPCAELPQECDWVLACSGLIE